MNKKIKIVPFQLKHIDLIDVRTHEIENILCVNNYKERLEILASDGICITVFYNNEILCILGVYEYFKKVCEIWILPSKLISQHGLIFARIMKKLLKQVWEINYYHRIQVTALNDELHNRFFTWLGFKRETPNGMNNFTIKKCNYNMWSITK